MQQIVVKSEIMSDIIENNALAIKAPANDSFRTFFYYLFMIISFTGIISVAMIVLYTVMMWIRRQWQRSRRRDRIARIRQEAIELGRVLRARAELEVPG